MRYRVFGIALTLVVAAGAAEAQGFPERPLRIIVAFTAGTAADIVARQIGIKLSEEFRQTGAHHARGRGQMGQAGA